MINVLMIYHGDCEFMGFRITGHAGYAAYGRDIICAGVSALAVNFVNSVLKLTPQELIYESDEDEGLLKVRIKGRLLPETKLLADSLITGLKGIEEEYGSEYIRISDAQLISGHKFKIIRHQEV